MEGNQVNTKGSARSSWSGKWAFILACAASAVGLGNLWRFPYLAAKYGGGTFLITYIVMVFTIGVALLLLENALGRYTGQSAIGAFASFGKKYKWIGIFASTIPFIVTSYYCVIGGWVTKYTVSYLAGHSDVISANSHFFFNNLISSPIESFFWMLVFLAIVMIVVNFGIKGGIEKMNLIMMPLLVVIALGVSIFTLTIPGALDGASYYLLPDISAFSPEMIVAALGQTFFSLSLAMGVMITYGSYLDKKTQLPNAVLQVGGFGVGVSLLAGLVIVPAAFAGLGSGEAVAENSGPELMFVILPSVFDHMGQVGEIVGFLFFILVLFAALTSAISLAETMVSILMDAFSWNRRRSVLVCTVFLFLVGGGVNLGYSTFSFLEPLGVGSTLLDFADFLANSVMMPIAAFLTCIFVGWIIKPAGIVKEIEASGKFPMKRAWLVMIRFIAPIAMILIMAAFIAAQLGFISI